MYKFFLNLLLLSTFYFSTCSALLAHTEKQNENRMGLHGMLLFSNGEELFASHLPMFHKPHDVQVIFSFSLADKELEQSLVQLVASKSEIWTIKPEHFDLSLLGNDKSFNTFSADIYHGHFERGGKLAHHGKHLKIKNVTLNNVLEHTKTSKTTYLKITPIGDNQVFYAVKIETRPGIDRIIKVSAPRAILEQLSTKVASSKDPFTTKDEDIATFLGIEKKNVKTLYLETGDLR